MKQKKLNTINFNSFKLFNKLFSNWITIKSDVNNLLPFMAETLCAPSFIENLDHRNQTAAHVCVRVALKCHCWGHISMSSIYTYIDRNAYISMIFCTTITGQFRANDASNQPTKQAQCCIFRLVVSLLLYFLFFRSLNAVFSILF